MTEWNAERRARLEGRASGATPYDKSIGQHREDLRAALAEITRLAARVEKLERLLTEADKSAWCDAVIGSSDHSRAREFLQYFYDWRRRTKAALNATQEPADEA